MTADEWLQDMLNTTVADIPVLECKVVFIELLVMAAEAEAHEEVRLNYDTRGGTISLKGKIEIDYDLLALPEKLYKIDHLTGMYYTHDEDDVKSIWQHYVEIVKEK